MNNSVINDKRSIIHTHRRHHFSRLISCSSFDCSRYITICFCHVGVYKCYIYMGREAGVSQLRGFNSRSRQLIYCIPRSSWDDKIRSCPSRSRYKTIPSLCVHTSQRGYIGTNPSSSILTYVAEVQIFNYTALRSSLH